MNRAKLSSAIGLLLTPFLFCQTGQADVVLTSVGVPVVETFDAFGGTGFSSTPSADQLDSNTYRVTGLSDGDGVFGGIHDTGDFARGASPGGVGQGGIYAFDVGAGDIGVGIQPTATDFTPGSFTIRLLNSTGQSVDTVDFMAETYVFNNADRSSIWTVELSLDDTVYTPLGSLQSDVEADASPEWVLSPLSFSVTSPIAVADGQQFFIRITGNDLAGGGSRDEFAIAGFNVSVGSAVPEPGTVGLIALVSLGLIPRRR